MQNGTPHGTGFIAEGRDVLGELTTQTSWTPDEELGPNRKLFLVGCTAALMAGTAYLAWTFLAPMERRAATPELEMTALETEMTVVEIAPVDLEPAATTPPEMTSLQAVPMSEPEDATANEMDDGLREQTARDAQAEPDPTAGLAGDSDGLDLPALKLSLNDAAFRALLLSGQGSAVARENNGTNWLVTPSAADFAKADIVRLGSEQSDLGARQIRIPPGGSLHQAIVSAMRNEVIFSGAIEVDFVFGRALDDALVADQKAFADQYSEQITAFRAAGGRPVIAGCWEGGRIILSTLSLGPTRVTLEDVTCGDTP